MKKFMLPILLFLLIIPLYVNAETCDTDKITISSITLEDKTDNVEELDEARGMEQLLIEQYTTLNRNNPMNNQINGISIKNKKRDIYISSGMNALNAIMFDTETYVGEWKGLKR